ncbi:hypothetical protein, partial [Desulfatitalea alkaliphila]
HRNFNTIFAEQLHNLSRGKHLFSPVDNLCPNLSRNAATLDSPLRDRLCKVDFAVNELMPQKTRVPGRVPEFIRDDLVGQPIHEHCPQRLVPALPLESGMKKKFGITHALCYMV